MKIDGCEFNHETNTRDLRTKQFDVCVFGMRTVLTVTMPHYIFERITASDWDRCRQEVTEHVHALISQSLQSGVYFLDVDRTKKQLLDQASAYAREWVYNHFGKLQTAAGNDAWAVPVTLERNLWTATQL